MWDNKQNGDNYIDKRENQISLFLLSPQVLLFPQQTKKLSVFLWGYFNANR